MVLSVGMKWHFRDQGHAEDVLMWWSYHYYVLGVSVVSDSEYDEFVQGVKAQWSISYATHCVGSSVAAEYPCYIREDRRPSALERQERDRMICERWLSML